MSVNWQAVKARLWDLNFAGTVLCAVSAWAALDRGWYGLALFCAFFAGANFSQWFFDVSGMIRAIVELRQALLSATAIVRDAAEVLERKKNEKKPGAGEA